MEEEQLSSTNVFVSTTPVALKQIFRYIHGTIEFGLHMYPSSLDNLISYEDAYWARSSYTRRSTPSYYVYFSDNLKSWSVKRQHMLSRSNAETGY